MTHRRRTAPTAHQRVVTAFVLPTFAASVAMAAVAGVSMSANAGNETTTTVSLASHNIATHAVRTPRRALSRSTDRSTISLPPAGLNFSPCANDTVEAGLQPGAIRVHRAVCHAFPQIARYGGLGAGEHANGKAIDIMTTDPTLGYEIAAFLKVHAAELDLFDVIYRQHIWTPVRSAEGWRMMPNRGSLTANHFDHVHVAVN